MMFLFVMVGCNEQDLLPFGDAVALTMPVIDVSPPALSFGPRAPGDPETLPFVVRNVGGGPLQVESVRIEGDAAFTLVDVGSFDLQPEDSLAFDVTFDAWRAVTVNADAVIVSDDPDRPEVRVALSGRGLAPQLEVLPPAHVFPDTNVGCADDLELVLQNVGAADLEIYGAIAESGGEVSLRDAASLAGVIVPPGGYVTTWVDYVPAKVGDNTSRVVVSSNDPRGDVAATQTGHADPGVSVTDTFPLTDDPPVDIVIAVDQSASMDDDAAALASNFGEFVKEIAGITSGWHLGVVTLDSGCFNGGVLEATTPKLDSLFAAAVAVGDDASVVNDEALLRLSDLAMVAWAPGKCNDGFRRDGAPLVVIVVTDEPERSTEQASVWTWDFWVDRYVGRVGSAALVSVSGVVDADGCNEGDAGYREAIAGTGGERLSICDADWAAHVVKLAEVVGKHAWTFPLSETPVPGSIQVALDGVTIASGWTYDPVGNTVRLDPALGSSSLTVTYSVAESCP